MTGAEMKETPQNTPTSDKQEQGNTNTLPKEDNALDKQNNGILGHMRLRPYIPVSIRAINSRIMVSNGVNQLNIPAPNGISSLALQFIEMGEVVEQKDIPAPVKDKRVKSAPRKKSK